MTKQPMTHETAMFASFFTPPEGQDELDYLREAQDALDTSQPGAIAAYGALQNRIVAVSESRLPKYHVNANFADFGEVEAKDAQEARDVAAQIAGYKSEADMVERVGGPSELVASEVESGK